MSQCFQKRLLSLAGIPHLECPQAPLLHVVGPIAPGMVAKIVFCPVNAALQQFHTANPVTLFAGQQALRLP